MLFVVKPTAVCNGACVYCSAWHGDEPDTRMSRDRVDALLARIAEWVEQARPRRISLLWHGGEPLIMGRGFYEHVQRSCEAIRQRAAHRSGFDLEIRHLMQSNITLVDEPWARFLRGFLHGSRLGSSFDPVPGIRLLRGSAGGSGASYEERWARGYRALRAAGVRVGVVCVIHRRHLDDIPGFYRAFREMDYDGGIRVNPLYGAGRAATNDELHITPRQWGDFLWELYQVWNEDGRRLRIDPLRGWDALARGRPARLACAFSGSCTRGFTGIRADGAVFSCGRSMDDEVGPFGSLLEAPLAALLASEPRRALLNRVTWLRQTECAGCRWWAFCHGGCPNDAHLVHGDPLRRTHWCAGRRSFLERAYGSQLPGALGAPPPGEPADGGYLFDVPADGAKEAEREAAKESAKEKAR